MTDYRPCLSVSIRTESDWEKVTFPITASPKWDGFRGVKKTSVSPDKILTRSLKPVVSKRIQEAFDQIPDNIDFEIITYEDEACTIMHDFNTIQENVTSETGKDFYFKFHVFDWNKDPELEYDHRMSEAEAACRDKPLCQIVDWRMFFNREDLEAFHEENLLAGLEGTVLRAFRGKYKFGKSTLNEEISMKIVPLDRSEGEILGFLEGTTNTNKKVKNRLGKSQRSSHKAGKIPNGTLGAFLMRWAPASKPVKFKIGNGQGLDGPTRQKIWDNQEDYLGGLITFEHRGRGPNNKPRFPSWIGFRSKDDL